MLCGSWCLSDLIGVVAVVRVVTLLPVFWGVHVPFSGATRAVRDVMLFVCC